MLVREQQLDFLTNYITKKSSNHSLIICGDFNINYKKNASLINNFINDLNLKSHSNINSNTVDYIFFRDSNDLFLDSSACNVSIKSSNFPSLTS